MKPSGGLTRTTGLQRKTPLQRRTPLTGDPAKDRAWRHRGMLAVLEQRRAAGSRTLPTQRRKPQDPDRKQPRTRPSRKGESKARELVYARSGGWCEARISGLCYGRAASWHHRRNRSQGGRWVASNGLHTCGSGTTGCHGALTNPPPGRRPEFEDNGWITTAEDPSRVRVLVPVHLVPWHHTLPKDQEQVWVLFTDDGRYRPVGEGSC